MIKKTLRNRDGSSLFTSNKSKKFSHIMEEALQNGKTFQNMDINLQDLQGITLDGAIFKDVHFIECDMCGANLSECHFENCRFSYCDLTDACFCYSDFVGCYFHQNCYTDADLSETCFIDCNFVGDGTTHGRVAGSSQVLNCLGIPPLTK